MELKARVALVTGGVHRVGKIISESLLAYGVRVAVHYHSSASAAETLEESTHYSDRDLITLRGDFRKVDEAIRIVDDCYEHFGRIDFLINNAAVYFPTPLGQTSEDDWELIFGVNLKAPYFCTQRAAEYMRRSGQGHVINIADVSAYAPWPDFVPYCSSKAGLIALTKGLATALAPAIQVNAIASGTVLLSDNASSEHVERIRQGTLLKRIGSPEDIAKAVLFLLRDGDYLTGAVIPVDGGARLADLP